MSRQPVLLVRDLRISFPEAGQPPAQAVRGLDLEVRAGEVHALVGESGAGKSVTTLSLLGLLPPAAAVSGHVSLKNTPLDRRSMVTRRGRDVGIVFQEPATHFNPGLRIGPQIAEVLTHHLGMERGVANRRVVALLTSVGLPDPRVARAYPHELSGGMCQRAMIAMAIACDPVLLLADEPTTALDATTQLQILRLLDRLRRDLSMAVLLVSHNLAVVQEIADRISVIYAGRIVESAATEALFAHPSHPYTQLLLAAIPDPGKRGSRLMAIPGRPPDARAVPGGCAFHPRCPYAVAACREALPANRAVGVDHTAACILATETGTTT